MTGGKVVVLGKTGKNFAAGMSGGIAYVLDADNQLSQRLNKELVMKKDVTDRQDMNDLRILLEKHIKETGSHLAQQILNDFDDWVVKFKKIVPVQYLHMLKSINNFKKIGYSCDEAELKAFQEFYQQEE